MTAEMVRIKHQLVSHRPAGCPSTILSLIVLVLTVANHTPLLSSDQIPGKTQQQPVAIVGATVYPISSEPIAGCTIVFDKGRITAIGPGAAIPDNAEVIRSAGKYVYPGLISAHTQIGLIEIGAVRASDDRSETGRINPNIRAEKAFNPESEIIPVTRANGITIAFSTPTGGLISGTSAAMMLDGWTWEEMTLKAPLALNVDWPSMSIPRRPDEPDAEQRSRKNRDEALREIREAFQDARAYMQAKKAAGTKGIPHHKTDSRWEAMIPVLEGKIPVVVWADEIRQIQAAIAWAEEEAIRLIIGGGHDAWRVADLLKRSQVPVIVGGTHRLPHRRFDPYDSPFTLPLKLSEAGIPFAIASDESAPHERNLPYHAATAAAYGLQRSEALRAITLSPALIFGIADRVGSLEVGKDATLIVTTGDPLEINTRVELEFIQGRKVDLTSRHTTLYEKYKEKYRRRTAGQRD